MTDDSGRYPGEMREPRQAAINKIAELWRDKLEMPRLEGRELSEAAGAHLKDPEWVHENADFIQKVNQAMCDGAIGVSMSGAPVDVRGKLESKTCPYESDVGSIEIPYISVSMNDQERPIYFFSGYSFHPDVAPKAANEPKPNPLKPQRDDRVFVLDTGWCDPANRPSIDVDPVPDHVGRGHGPAIVSLIKQLAQLDDDHVQLRQIRYDLGALECAVTFPAPDASPEIVVGFDEDALLGTLTELENDLERGDIVNLSLGTVTCPHLMAQYDPVGEWIAKLPKEVRFVVAAGNHGTHVPSWPAFYASGSLNPATARQKAIDSKEDPEIAKAVHSVGSLVEKQGPRSDFSAHGDWVTAWKHGSDVSVMVPPGVKLPGGNVGPAVGMNNALWSGTSFAAPTHAAEIARPIDNGRPAKPDNLNFKDLLAEIKKNPQGAGGLIATKVAGLRQGFLKRR